MSDSDPISLRVVRTFAAPAAQVFEAWTRPELMMRWFCPRGFTMLSVEIDLRVGGVWRSRMQSPAGDEYIQHGVYQAIVVPKRLVFTQVWEPTQGDPGSATLVTVTFTDRGEVTDVTLVQTGFDTIELRDSHLDGWATSLDKLSTLLAKHAQGLR